MIFVPVVISCIMLILNPSSVVFVYLSVAVSVIASGVLYVLSPFPTRDTFFDRIHNILAGWLQVCALFFLVGSLASVVVRNRIIAVTCIASVAVLSVMSIALNRHDTVSRRAWSLVLLCSAIVGVLVYTDASLHSVGWIIHAVLCAVAHLAVATQFYSIGARSHLPLALIACTAVFLLTVRMSARDSAAGVHHLVDLMIIAYLTCALAALGVTPDRLSRFILMLPLLLLIPLYTLLTAHKSQSTTSISSSPPATSDPTASSPQLLAATTSIDECQGKGALCRAAIQNKCRYSYCIDLHARPVLLDQGQTKRDETRRACRLHVARLNVAQRNPQRSAAQSYCVDFHSHDDCVNSCANVQATRHARRLYDDNVMRESDDEFLARLRGEKQS